MIDELKQWEYDKGYEKGKADTLKVIEAEIQEECTLNSPKWNANNVQGLSRALEIIDKHIEVGDNNEID